MAGPDPGCGGRAEDRASADPADPADHGAPGAPEPIAGAAVLADRTSTSLLAAAFLGHRRFGDFQDLLRDAAPQTLTARLAPLTDQAPPPSSATAASATSRTCSATPRRRP